MGSPLRDLEVLALDGQASGATPVYGDLLELGWVTGSAGDLRFGVPESRWIVPRTGRRVGRAVRELTGWSEACLAEAVAEAEAWDALRRAGARLAAANVNGLVPTVIHYARFELPFLRDLHERSGAGEFPFDVVCVHAVAARLFPDLPRRSIRALAGFLGHSPELVRRAAGHVEATAFIWRAIVPQLEARGVDTWEALRSFLEAPAPARGARRVFPLAAERRRALPDRPGVYRFRRLSGDVIYVGKATSLKKRVASHFKSSGPATERGLELLTQVHDIEHTETKSLLEAALLETDEIKRLDPPYNVALRAVGRAAWFASRDLGEAVPEPDDVHSIGPLPSERAVASLAAIVALMDGAGTHRLRAAAVAVPQAFAPDVALFETGFREFAEECLARLGGDSPSAQRRAAAASRALWLERGRAEPESPAEEAAPDTWDVARVKRRLERNLVQAGLLVRRARFLCLLADSVVAFVEPGTTAARALVLLGARVVDQRDLPDVESLRELPGTRPRPLRERRRSFDAAAYDRVRVISTELRRIVDEGGRAAIRVGVHVFAGDRLVRLLRGI
jgi:DNA polymerase-3 subunit epsilon